MKANLFELLLSLFEKTLSQLKETQQADSSSRLLPSNEVNLSTESKIGVEIQVFKQASSSAMRFVSVVTNTRSPIFTVLSTSSNRSST